jgi:sugar-specific transcriptional regulator TrmB
MSSDEEAEEDKSFIVVKAFLTISGKLDEMDATIYALGLKEGIITSSDVAMATGLRQTTSGDRLKRLASKGFFEVTPHVGETPASGRGHPRMYRVVHPRIVLGDVLKINDELRPALDIIDQHLEVIAESAGQEGDLWLIQPQKIALKKASTMLRGAERSIKIYSHDCTWFWDEEIKNAMKDAISRGVTVQVLATNPDRKIAKGLASMNAELYILDFQGPPFCLIDDFLLILPKREGTLHMQYSLISTNARYLVDNFCEMYVKLLSCSKPYGGE